MKILLLGEFSGFYKNLKNGLENLGCNVTWVAQCDSWKKIDGIDFELDTKLPRPFRGLHIAFRYLQSLKYLKNYDVVLIINPRFFKKYIGRFLLQFIVTHNKKIFLSACADDVEFLTFGTDGGFRYWPYSNLEGKHTQVRKSTHHERYIHSLLLPNITKVIPTSTMYKIAWKHSSHSGKITNAVPMPVDTSKIPYHPLELSHEDKIVFFHGLSREDFKGTYFIREAMRNIQKKYPNEVECIILGGLPLQEYLKVLARAHIVIDQCKTYCYNGMNVAYALAMGKIVMGGCEPEVLDEFNLKKRPIIDIQPDCGKIEAQMEFIIKNKKNFKAWSCEGRQFIEKYHAAENVAKSYLKIFKSN